MTYYDIITTERKAAANSTFAIGGVSCSADKFVEAENFMLSINICVEITAHCKSANRWAQDIESSNFNL